MGNLVEGEEGEQVKLKRRLRNLQESFRAKRRKVSGSVSKAVGLAAAWVDGAVVASLSGADSINDSCIDELTGQLESTSAEVISLTAKLLDLEDVRDKARQVHEDLLKKIRTEAETPQERTLAERDGALLCYHGVLQSIRGIVKAADERSDDYIETLTQVRPLLEETHKAKTDVLLSSPSLERSWVVEWERALEAKKLELETSPDLAAENTALRTEASRVENSVETLGWE